MVSHVQVQSRSPILSHPDTCSAQLYRLKDRNGVPSMHPKLQYPMFPTVSNRSSIQQHSTSLDNLDPLIRPQFLVGWCSVCNEYYLMRLRGIVPMSDKKFKSNAKI